jgi:hypothetical protein
MSYTLIERKTLESSASNITFDNIPQFYSDLVILTSVRGDNANAQGLRIYFNGLTSNLSSIFLFGDGSGVSQGTGTDGFAGSLFGTGATANTFGNGMIYIPNYAGSTNKSFTSDNVTENNATTSFQSIGVGRWASTAPITSFTVFGRTDGGGTNNLIAGSSISLYGINRQQAIGAPKAVGGAISFVNGYWVHSFTGSGTFTAQEPIECEYLVVAGGGGGGGDRAGGGGAGGYRSSMPGELSGANSAAEPKLVMNANASHIITVGSGGVGGGISSGFGTDGLSSSFGTIVSIGGGGGAGGFVLAARRSGGSGGGSGGQDGGFGLTGGAGTAGQGFKGGDGIGSPFHAAGGGGASAAGGNAGGSAGAGGAGLFSSITGSLVARAGGGGGAANNSTAHGAGGIGGGGAGGKPPVDGTINTGGGAGGGGNFPQTAGANGGSGIVIIRYKA